MSSPDFARKVALTTTRVEISPAILSTSLSLFSQRNTLSLYSALTWIKFGVGIISFTLERECAKTLR